MGEYTFTSCPKKEILPSIWEFLQYVDWARDGHFPKAGGVDDQSQSFMNACRSLWAQEMEIEEKKRKNG